MTVENSTSPFTDCPSKVLNLEGLEIEVMADKHDVSWYQQRKIYEEKISLLYNFIRDGGYTNFVDVGANVGLVSILAKRSAPEINLIAVEADPRLARLAEQNFYRHDISEFFLVNAIAGAENNKKSPFSLNPNSTLDNRVSVPKWEQIEVPMVTMGSVLNQYTKVGQTFIKIDTQGYERNVLKGMEQWLLNSNDWVIKMEFAPDWLRSQGTDPARLLDYLQLHFQFVEFPERIPFSTPDLDALFSHPITFKQQSKFLDYVSALNKGGTGWVDLLVRPR